MQSDRYMYATVVCVFSEEEKWRTCLGIITAVCVMLLTMEPVLKMIVEYHCTSNRGYEDPHCLNSCIGERGKRDPQCNVNPRAYCGSEYGRYDTNCIELFSKEVAIPTGTTHEPQHESTCQSCYNFCYACFFFSIVAACICAYAAMKMKRASTLKKSQKSQGRAASRRQADLLRRELDACTVLREASEG